MCSAVGGTRPLVGIFLFVLALVPQVVPTVVKAWLQQAGQAAGALHFGCSE
jgi:hypothetical protein